MRTNLALWTCVALLTTPSFVLAQEKAPPTEQKDKVIRDSVGKALGNITAEIVKENQAAERVFTLLARVEVQPNEIVEFYEPAPGYILISGAGAPDSPSRRVEMARTPGEAWHLAAPGFDMPPALRDAIERSKRRDLAPKDLPPKKTKPDVLKESGGGKRAPQRSGGWCDVQYFTLGYGNCPHYGWEVCLNNWWDGRYAYHHDAWHGYANVCPATGPVTFRIRSDEGFGGLWTVNQDTVRWFSWADHPCAFWWNDCPYVRADVEQAIGVRFHFRFLIIPE